MADETADFEKIIVRTGCPAVDEAFVGRWLVEPDPDESRSRLAGHAGAYWGVAITESGRYAIYIAHCAEVWPGRLVEHDSLADAAGVAPATVLAAAAAAARHARD
jgi:hypothetical protein